MFEGIHKMQIQCFCVCGKVFKTSGQGNRHFCYFETDKKKRNVPAYENCAAGV